MPRFKHLISKKQSSRNTSASRTISLTESDFQRAPYSKIIEENVANKQLTTKTVNELSRTKNDVLSEFQKFLMIDNFLITKKTRLEKTGSIAKLSHSTGNSENYKSIFETRKTSRFFRAICNFCDRRA